MLIPHIVQYSLQYTTICLFTDCCATKEFVPFQYVLPAIHTNSPTYMQNRGALFRQRVKEIVRDCSKPDVFQQKVYYSVSRH